MDIQKTALKRLNILTVRDFLYHFPFRYEQAGGESSVGGLVLGQEVSIVGVLEKMETKKAWKSRRPVSEGYLRDSSGRIKMRWFNQPYIAKMYLDGTRVRAVGKVTGSPSKLYLANPQLQKISATDVSDAPIQTIQIDPELSSLRNSPEVKNGRSVALSVAQSSEAIRRRDDATGPMTDEVTDLFAIYPETRGVTSLWFRHAIKKIIASGILDSVEDPLPKDILDKYHLPSLATALVWMHSPQKLGDSIVARKRFAFEEVFFIQLGRGVERALQAKEQSFAIDAPQDIIDEFVSEFPFKPTKAQTKAIDTILGDMQSGKPMSRLLEGDVGSGKTAVAATAAFAVVKNNFQVAYMAPTEILAKQHFESFIKFFEKNPINIGLITGSGCYKFPSKVKRGETTNISRAQLLKWVANGEIPVVIGTHALIQKSVVFKHLALVIIDEQHRFGVNQRKKLAKKDARIPHLLSMTATPIPRTLALTIYGDLDLTLLDEMPAGRKPIITEVVKPTDRGRIYEKMRKELEAGRQAYVICPRIDEPDPDKAFAVMAKSVKEEAKRLKRDVFPEYQIAILHSKMTPKEKDDTMRKFSEHEIDILVATSVVEVGVNVPNATMIFIEGAERFGLSQLHQLRGRVVRSNHQAYCFVSPESKGEPTMLRLKALTTAKNGFELAEADLLQRGAGQLGGAQQWGISDIGMEALKNLKLVEAARKEALDIVKKDETLSKHISLQHALFAKAKDLHFE